MADFLQKGLRLMTGGAEPPLRGRAVDPKDINSKVEACEVRKTRLKLEWKEMLAMHAGRQWMGIDVANRQLVSVTAPYRITMSVENLIQAFAAVAVSMLTRNQPIPVCVPKSDAPGASEAAKIGSALLRHIWDVAEVATQDELGTIWGVLTGNAGYKVYWDHEAGNTTHTEFVDDPENMVPDELTGELIPAQTEIEVKDGLPVVEILAPFSFGWNDATVLERSPWYYHRAIFTVEDVQERYKDTLQGAVLKADADPEDLQAGGIIRFDTTSKGSAKPLGITVTEWWRRPCEDYPEGLHCVVTADKVLLEEDWPETMLCPIYHLGLEPTPGSPWFRTPFKDGIPIQHEINRITSDCMDHTTLASHPAILSPVDSQVGVWSKTPGAKLQYNPQKGAPPTTFNPEKMEPWVLTFLDNLHQRFEYVIGISGVMLGQAAFSRMSGRISGQFIEQTTARWANVALRKGRLLSKVGIALLELWRRYGPEQTTVEIVGNDGIESYIEVARDGFSYKTLRVEMDEVLASSRQAKIEMYERWLQYGAIDGAAFVKLVAVINPELADLQGTGPDRAMAQRHIAMMQNGVMPTLKPPMNWALLFESVSQYMKSAEYVDLCESEPGTEQLFDQYLAQVDAILNPPKPGIPGAGPTTPKAFPADGISGQEPLPPGPQGVPPEMSGVMPDPGVDQAEESAIRAM